MMKFFLCLSFLFPLWCVAQSKQPAVKKSNVEIIEEYHQFLNSLPRTKNGFVILPGQLDIGKKLPNIPLGNYVWNNNSGKKNFSEFAGKLVILDFWNRTCGACIANFPNLSALQKKFADKIQIFLVNPQDSLSTLQKYFKRELIPDNLITIIDQNRQIKKLFPERGAVGYQVWIDPNGIVALRGASYNGNEQKINELLAGKPIEFSRDEEDWFDKYRPSLANNNPIYKSLATSNTKVSYNSLFTPYSDEFGNVAGEDFFSGKYLTKKIIDSSGGTSRSAYLNRTIPALYSLAFSDELESSKVNVLWGLNIVLKVRDTSLYGNDLLTRKTKTTDYDLRKNRFCYEQVVPIQISQEKRNTWMKEDLNRYFGSLYGTQGGMQKVKVSCYVLVRTTKEDKLKHNPRSINGYWLTNDSLKVSGMRLSELFHNSNMNVVRNFLSPLVMIMDDTGLLNPIDITLPRKINSLEGLRKAIAAYDLDLIKVEKETNMLVIEENNVLNQ